MPPLLLDVDRNPAPVGRFEAGQQAVDVHGVVPDVQLAGAGVPAHPRPVGLPAGGGHRLVGTACLHPVLPAGDHQAGGQTFHVPFERTRKGLVEISQVEGEIPLWRRPEAEVEHVSVAAELRVQSAVGWEARSCAITEAAPR